MLGFPPLTVLHKTSDEDRDRDLIMAPISQVPGALTKAYGDNN